MSADRSASLSGARKPSIAWKIALLLLVVKLLQWGVLAVTLVIGELPGLPEVMLGSHLVAGLWVGSSFVFLLWRRWLGALSSVVYSTLSAVVSVTLLVQGTDGTWNVITFAGSAGIIIAVVICVFRKDFHHSRW